MAAPVTPLFRTLRWLHRWVGLTVGLLFAIVSASGSLLLFQPQFFRWAHGDILPADLAGRPIGSIETWVANGRAAAPSTLQGPIAVWAPHTEHNATDAGMMIFMGQPPGGLGNMGFLAVLVEPDTGKVLGQIDVDRSPAWAPLFLHRDLWTGQTGQVVSGVMAIGSLFLIAAGLYLWWPPRTALLAKKLSPRPWWKLAQAAPLHDWVGVWTLVLLLALTATGLALVRPAWIEPMMAALPATLEADEPAAACDGAMGFDTAIARARQLAPGGAFAALYPHDMARNIWEVGFKAPDSDAPQRQTHVELDMNCGHVTMEFGPSRRTARDMAQVWMSGIHDGTAFGTSGQVIVSIAGLSPIVLAWSGVMMWWRKRTRKPRD